MECESYVASLGGLDLTDAPKGMLWVLMNSFLQGEICIFHSITGDIKLTVYFKAH